LLVCGGVGIFVVCRFGFGTHRECVEHNTTYQQLMSKEEDIQLFLLISSFRLFVWTFVSILDNLSLAGRLLLQPERNTKLNRIFLN